MRLSDSAGEPQIQVDLRIDASKILYQTANNRRSDKLQIAVFYGDANGKYLGDDWQTLEMNLEEETYQKAVREGISHSALIPLRSSHETLKIVVYDCGSDKVGSVLKALR